MGIESHLQPADRPLPAPPTYRLPGFRRSSVVFGVPLWFLVTRKKAFQDRENAVTSPGA